MEYIDLVPHHVDTALGMLLMPDIRPCLISGLKTDRQKEFAEEMIKSYLNGDLKSVFLFSSKEFDYFCIRCNPERKEPSCDKPELPLRLHGKEFPFGKNNIKSLIDQFDAKILYSELTTRLYQWE